MQAAKTKFAIVLKGRFLECLRTPYVLLHRALYSRFRLLRLP